MRYHFYKQKIYGGSLLHWCHHFCLMFLLFSVIFLPVHPHQHPGAKGFLFDGFPRTAIQAEELDDLLAQKDTCIDVMLALDVSEEELIKRLVKRENIINIMR